MKKLVLVICFAELVLATARSFNEKMSPYPKPLHMQRSKSRNLISLRQAEQNEKIRRILHLMHLRNPYCLRKFYNALRFYQRPSAMLRPLRMPAFRNDGINQLAQVSYFNKMRQNQLREPQSRRYFANDKMIFQPPHAKLGRKGVNEPQSENTPSESLPDFPAEKPNNTKEMQGEFSIGDIFRPKEESRKYAQTFRRYEDQLTRGNSTVSQSVQKGIDPRKRHPSRFSQRMNSTSSFTTTYSNISSRFFWSQPRPTKIQPYEVEEIIEEELSVNVNDKNEPFANLQFGESLLSSRSNAIEKITNAEDGQKMPVFHDVIDSSINTVLKTLMAPMAKTIPASENNPGLFPEEQYQNREYKPHNREFFIATPSQNKTFSDHDFPNYNGTASVKRPQNRHEQSKNLKISNTQIDEKSFNREQYSSESLKYDSILSLKPTLRVEYQNTLHAESTTHTSISVYTEKSIPHLTENLMQNKTTLMEAENSLFSLEPNHINQSLLVTVGTQKPVLNNFTTQQPLVKQEKIDVTSSVNDLTVVKSTTTNYSENWTEISTGEIKTFIPTQNLKTKESSTAITTEGAELSTRNFQDFTDHPTTFNLLTTVKSDLKKNSRKMHFGQEPSETTSNHISEVGSTGPRRSDILITENSDDYDDVDNDLSTLNYLDKLKQNNSFPFFNSSLNSTSESLIPFIPAVITDLREGKISAEDVLILSEAFGKYWSAITALSNITNLDMLPLLKMKNEEDLKKVLEISFLQNTEATTTKTSETESTKEGNIYDYIDEYDFYQYVLGSEQEEKEKKRKKLRPKRSFEDDSKKVTRSHLEVF